MDESNVSALSKSNSGHSSSTVSPVNDFTEKEISPDSLRAERKIQHPPGKGLYTEKARQSRLEFLKELTPTKLQYIEKTTFDPASLCNNIEAFLGSVEVPVGVSGPLKINGTNANGVYYVPVATSEGALIASMSRGSYALTLSGGVSTHVVSQRMMRVPMFLLDNLRMAANFIAWISRHRREIIREAEKHSNYARLIELKPQLLGRAVHVHFVYETGDAAGQNMTTTCTWEACNWILSKIKLHHEINICKFVIEGGLSSDKRVSNQSLINGRGIQVQAEAYIPERIVRRVLKTTPKDIKDIWTHFSAICTSSGACGLNVNIANAIAGIFTSTGQDIACVHESSLANTTVDLTETGDLYIAMSIPGLVIGTVGGGTWLPHQRECLEMIDCQGPGSSRKLAEIIAGSCLALDLSTTAAVVAGHFAKAHEVLGRNRGVNHLKLSDLDCSFFQAHFRKHNNDNSIEIKHVVPMNNYNSDGSLITEMTSRKLRKTLGLLPYNIFYVNRDGYNCQQVMVKIKPTSNEVVGALNQFAALCNPELAKEFDKHKHKLGLSGTDQRELAIFRQNDSRFTNYTPKVFGIYEDTSREAFVLIEELLTDLELMNSADDISEWTTQHRKAALKDIAECHSIWFGREDELKSKAWTGHYPTTERRLELTNLYKRLVEHALDEFPQWIRADEMDRVIRIINTIQDWWPKVDAMQKTLVHNDFNPRNLAFRKTSDGLRLCAYDWELATIHLPQADVVELLAYTLTDDMDRTAVYELVDFHRSCLEKLLAFDIDKRIWREGFRYAVWDYFISRILLYLLTHGFRHFAFMERIYHSMIRLLDMTESTESE